MNEQILALAVQSGFKLDWAISNCTGQFESFHHAAIESYKAELLKEVGEPIYIEGTCEIQNWKWIRLAVDQANEYERWGWKIRKLYTFDQVAAAILKATGPLEKEIERLKTVPMKYRRMAFNAQLQNENAELCRQLASAQLDNDQLRAELAALKAENEWQPIETAPKDEFVLLAGPSGYTTIETVFTTGRMCSDYHAGRWIDHANDDLTDWGFNPTHWMPLPKPPAMAQGDKP